MSDERNLVQFVSDICLLATASWGFTISKNHPFAAVAFGAYAVRGCCGIIKYFISDDTVKSVYDKSGEIVTLFCFPLFAAEMHSKNLEPWALCVTHLVSPLLELLNESVSINFKALSVGYSIGVIAFIDFSKNRFYASYLILIPLILYITSTQDIDVPDDLLNAINSLISWSVFADKIPKLF